jgi:hypothetical protein
MEAIRKKSQFGLRLFLLLVALVASLTAVWSAKRQIAQMEKGMLRNEYGIKWDADTGVWSESNRQYNLDLFRARNKISDAEGGTSGTSSQ